MLFTCTQGKLTPFDTEAEKLVEKQEGKVLDMRRLTKDKRRTLDQNALYHAWCSQVEREHGMDPGYAHRLHKYMWGLAILRERYPAQVGHLRTLMVGLDYETRLEMMEIMPCSSKFQVKEMTRFMDAVQRHWAGEGTVLE